MFELAMVGKKEGRRNYPIERRTENLDHRIAGSEKFNTEEKQLSQSPTANTREAARMKQQERSFVLMSGLKK